MVRQLAPQCAEIFGAGKDDQIKPDEHRMKICVRE